MGIKGKNIQEKYMKKKIEFLVIIYTGMLSYTIISRKNRKDYFILLVHELTYFSKSPVINKSL